MSKIIIEKQDDTFMFYQVLKYNFQIVVANLINYV